MEQNISLRNLRYTLNFSASLIGQYCGLGGDSIEAIEKGRRKLTIYHSLICELRLGVAAESLRPGTNGHVRLSDFDIAWWRRSRPDGKSREDWTYEEGDLEFHRSLPDGLCENRIKALQVLWARCILAGYAKDSICNRNRVQAMWFDATEALFSIIDRYEIRDEYAATQDLPEIRKALDQVFGLQAQSSQQLLKAYFTEAEQQLLINFENSHKSAAP